MRFLKWAMTCMALTLAGCAINLSKVKYDEERTAANSRFGTLKVEQSVCEVERQLALYTDDTRQLWLLCPYRYEGRTVPLVAYIGPDPKKPPVEFTHDAAVTKTKSLKKEALRPCGTNRYCVNLDAYGYMDFSIQWAANKALIRYTDLSGGLKDLDTFYEQLDGRATTSPLDPQLVKLVKFTSVAERVERLATLEQLRNVTTQLRAVGLQDSGPIRPALERRRVALETEEFRRQGTFAGFQSAYALTKDAADLASMQRLAANSDEKSGVFSALVERYSSAPLASTLQVAEEYAVTPQDQTRLAELKRIAEQERLAELQRQEEARQMQLRRAEEARQAEVRRQDAQRAAEVRRQDEARMAAQRAQEARAAEERCMNDANCRRAWEERRAQCVQKVQACRQGCDRVTGAGSYGSFIANLSAAALARTCYAGCTCDNGFGDLLTRFNLATAGSPASGTEPAKATAAVKPAVGSKAKVFECKIYCKSATGPTITRRFEAASRKDAAQIAGERANAVCAQDGKSHASPVALAESQCQER